MLIHRAGTLIRLRDAKTVTSRHPLVPGDQSGRPSETHFSSFGFVRPHAALEWMFDHCENIMLPLGGSTVAHSPSGHADPIPLSRTRKPLRQAFFWYKSGRPKARHTSETFYDSMWPGSWMFGQCEAILAQLSGSTTAYSPSRHADLTPGRKNRYTTPPSGTSKDVQASHTLRF